MEKIDMMKRRALGQGEWATTVRGIYQNIQTIPKQNIG
jgi:hypothetical protein